MPKGGKRNGAGRKPKPRIPIVATKSIASRVLAAKPANDWPGEEERWMELLNARDDRLRFDVLRYLTDRRDGKPAESVIAEGKLVIEVREIGSGDRAAAEAGAAAPIM
jgi:hypothetical protein